MPRIPSIRMISTPSIPELDTLGAFFDALRSCWTPPPEDTGAPWHGNVCAACLQTKRRRNRPAARNLRQPQCATECEGELFQCHHSGAGSLYASAFFGGARWCARWPADRHPFHRRQGRATGHGVAMSDPANTMILDTSKGKVSVAMRPDLAPATLPASRNSSARAFTTASSSTASSTASWRRPAARRAPAPAARARSTRPSSTRSRTAGARYRWPGRRIRIRRQPVFHLLCRRGFPQRRIHRLGTGDRRHGKRRQDQARRTSAESRSHHLGENGGRRLS